MNGLAIIRTLPLGSSAAGPSAIPRSSGKSGPACQPPLKIAVWAAPQAVAPVAKTLPALIKTAGPTSNEAKRRPPQSAADSQSCTAVPPPGLVHLPDAGL